MASQLQIEPNWTKMHRTENGSGKAESSRTHSARGDPGLPGLEPALGTIGGDLA
jgi:hypothetical protein